MEDNKWCTICKRREICQVYEAIKVVKVKAKWAGQATLTELAASIAKDCVNYEAGG